jgi:hypothetical protein
MRGGVLLQDWGKTALWVSAVRHRLSYATASDPLRPLRTATHMVVQGERENEGRGASVRARARARAKMRDVLAVSALDLLLTQKRRWKAWR